MKSKAADLQLYNITSDPLEEKNLVGKLLQRLHLQDQVNHNHMFYFPRPQIGGLEVTLRP
jgi:hypothetical protein